MRPDVKLGITVAMVVMMVLGGYYLYRRGREAPITVDGPAIASPTNSDKNPSRAVSKKPATVKRPRSSRQQVSRPTPRTAPVAPGRSGARPSAARHSAGRRNVKRQPAISPSKRQSTTRNLTSPSTHTSTANKNAPTLSRSALSGSGKSSTAAKRQANPRRNPPVKTSANGTTQRPAARPKPAGMTAHRAVPLTATRANNSPAAIDTHRVLPGDTLASIAQMYYGQADLASLLLKANPSVANPRSLRVGMLIKIPAGPNEPTNAHAGVTTTIPPTTKRASGKVYTVKPGDSLFVIAKHQLGNGARWKEIFELNKQALGQNPNRLKVGQKLALPTS